MDCHHTVNTHINNPKGIQPMISFLVLWICISVYKEILIMIAQPIPNHNEKLVNNNPLKNHS